MRNGRDVARAELTADRSDALSFLEAQPDQSLGGLIAIQVVEHLESRYLMRVIETAYRKLKPGAMMVLETINTACWAAFFDSYIRDFTHAHPLHPETLRYLAQASGFAIVELRYLSPVAEHEKLPLVRIVSERGCQPDGHRAGGSSQRPRKPAHQPALHPPGLRGHRPAVGPNQRAIFTLRPRVIVTLTWAADPSFFSDSRLPMASVA
jgi:hypothetical protein